MGYSKQLEKEYIFDGNFLIFEDGVKYSIDEALFLSKQGLDNIGMNDIHLVKKFFDGIILHDGNTQKMKKKIKEDKIKIAKILNEKKTLKPYTYKKVFNKIRTIQTDLFENEKDAIQIDAFEYYSVPVKKGIHS